MGEAIKFKAQFKFLRDFPFGKCCFFAKKTIENKPFREFMADWKFPSKAFLDLLSGLKCFAIYSTDFSQIKGIATIA